MAVAALNRGGCPNRVHWDLPFSDSLAGASFCGFPTVFRFLTLAPFSCELLYLEAKKGSHIPDSSRENRWSKVD